MGLGAAGLAVVGFGAAGPGAAGAGDCCAKAGNASAAASMIGRALAAMRKALIGPSPGGCGKRLGAGQLLGEFGNVKASCHRSGAPLGRKREDLI